MQLARPGARPESSGYHQLPVEGPVYVSHRDVPVVGQVVLEDRSYAERIHALNEGSLCRHGSSRVDLRVDRTTRIDGSRSEPSHDQRVAQGLSTTAVHCVNAVPLLCDAEEPGFKTYLDLKMIMGCMGTYEAKR